MFLQFYGFSKKTLVICMIVLLICAFCGCTSFNNVTVEEDVYSEEFTFFVHFIDVGQGDCALVQTEAGNILIDAGTYDSEKDIVKYIDSLGIKEFEYGIFTHPHTDHIGSADKILNQYKFNNIILPNAISTTPIYENMLDAIENENCEVILGEAGKSFVLGDAVIDIFAPCSYYFTDDLNNMSIVAKLTYKDMSFLFTGDAEVFSEMEMIKHGYDLNVDVLKVSHHGSSTSSCKEFLQHVSPSVAVISVGKDNEYGHPHYETIESLEALGTDMYVTYEVGTIMIATDGYDFSVTTEK